MSVIETVETVDEMRRRLDAARASGTRVGFVPTMGYLHAGHTSLIERSVAETDLTVVSVFVNPLQFAPTEDLAAYPRDLPRDTAIAEAAGARIVFAPEVEEMYPQPVATTVSVADLSAPLEGEKRPTHFDGVATVVTKLFSIVGACRAYFGDKDFQQLAIVRRLAADLSLPVEVVGCPIVREPDGLALSSRNVYLSETERAAAAVLHRALRAAQDAYASGEDDPAALGRIMSDVIAAEPLATVAYAAAVDPRVFRPPDRVVDDSRLLVSAQVGPARLLDNAPARG